MAITGTIYTTGTIVGLLFGSLLETVSWAITNGIGTVTKQVLVQAANNTFNAPAGTKLCFIIPPTTNTQAVTLKGVNGDTGLSLNISEPTILALPTDTTVSPVINLGAGTNQTFTFLCL
jgi:hypothetical protein